MKLSMLILSLALLFTGCNKVDEEVEDVNELKAMVQASEAKKEPSISPTPEQTDVR